MRQRGGERRAAPSGGMERLRGADRIGVRRERARQSRGSAPPRAASPPSPQPPLRSAAALPALPSSLPWPGDQGRGWGGEHGGVGGVGWGVCSAGVRRSRHFLSGVGGELGPLRQCDTPLPATSRVFSARRGYLDQPRGGRERCPAWERFRPGERTGRPPPPPLNLFIPPSLPRTPRTARCEKQSGGQLHYAKLGHAGLSPTGQGRKSPVPALSVFSRLPLGPGMILGLSSSPPIGWGCRIIMITS